MKQILVTIFFLLVATISKAQQSDFELKNIRFKGLGFRTTKEAIIQSLGQGKRIETNYEGGFYANDQEGGPYYQLAYSNFNYIGSDKEKFVLEHIIFDVDGKTKLNYKHEILSGQTTEAEFIRMLEKR